MDVLSDIVAALRVRSTGLATLDLTAPWRLGTREHPATGLFTVLDGECVLDQRDGPQVRVDPGDLIFIAAGSGGVLRSSEEARASPSDRIFEGTPSSWSPGHAARHPRLVDHGGGGAPTTILMLALSLHGDGAVLPADLPSILRIDHRQIQDFPWLSRAMDLLKLEATSDLQGGPAVAARLAELLFVHVLRAHLALHPAAASSLLRGPGHVRIARALGAIHSDPAQSWTVTGLAREAAMSRSAFSERFGAAVGQPPLEYLTQRRMDLAAARLARGEPCLQRLASDLGYRSQHAFSHAFKRARGMAPTEYRRRAQRASGLE